MLRCAIFRQLMKWRANGPFEIAKTRHFRTYRVWHGHCSTNIDNRMGVDGMTVEAGVKSDAATNDFSAEQKRYLEGFVAGAAIAKVTRGASSPGAVAAPEPVGP